MSDQNTPTAGLVLAYPADAPPPLRNATILLADDTFTTGTKLNGVYRNVLGFGATRVDGFVLARRGWTS